jgi:hypothetical protein
VEPAALPTDALVGIVLAAVAAVALVVGLLAWRHFCRGSKVPDDEPATHQVGEEKSADQTAQFVTMVNPNGRESLSCELTEEQVD